MTVTPLGWDQDCSLKIREPEVPALWFLDPGGWSKTAAVSLYFIFPGICTLSLNFLTLEIEEPVDLKTSVLWNLNGQSEPWPSVKNCVEILMEIALTLYIAFDIRKKVDRGGFHRADEDATQHGSPEIEIVGVTGSSLGSFIAVGSYNFLFLFFSFIEFIYMVYYIDRLSYVKPSLHLWDKAYLQKDGSCFRIHSVNLYLFIGSSSSWVLGSDFSSEDDWLFLGPRK
ncbi:hypothetical protein STEG23_003142 [Scotinomys teguina]